MSEKHGAGEEDAEHGVGNHQRWEEGRQRLAHQELLSPDRCDENGLEGALLALADQRVGRERGGHDRPDDEQVERESPIRVSSFALGIDVLMDKSSIIGRVTKISGRTAMVKIMTKRLRR